MKPRCSECEIVLRFREMIVCNAINEGLNKNEYIQMCSDCLQ